MGFMLITWVCNSGENHGKKLRHENGTPFNLSAIDVVTKTKWKIHAFGGAIECVPYTEKGELDVNLIAGFRLYTPNNRVNPAPDAPKTDVDRRPELVANVDGWRMRLERGHAVIVICGAGILHVSWDYPEYEHPKV